MTNKELDNIADKAASEYEDGETGLSRCIELYCEDLGFSDSICNLVQKRAFEKGALEAGIPLSVIRGEKKLTDFFSEDYIDMMCNRNKDIK